MVKKKTPGQEEEMHIQDADNKANDNTIDGSGNTGTGVPPSAEASVQQEDIPKVEQKESDKVVKEEKPADEKLAEMQDKYLRLSAEFDNYRKRTLREKMELAKYASEDILLKILPVMDDFERALAVMQTDTDCSAVKSGIELIYGKFTDFLKQNGIKEIESLNSAFNVDLHDAVAKIPVEDEAKRGMIVDVVKKGYFLQDKVIRHAKVVVGE
jgi:molecular chaperone GrpE